jgi:hypothetical protein
VFVLPFSAGHPKERGNGESVSHDGSISGIVFLVSVVVVLCIILVIGSVGQDDDKETDIGHRALARGSISVEG